MATTTTPKASPVLLERIGRLEICSGHWLLIRDGEPETDCSHQWHHTPERHLETCLVERWRGVSLGFVPTYCGWSDYDSTGLAGKANYTVLTDPASTPDPLGGILTVDYGWNGSGVVLDLLRVPADVIETVEALEAYPLISDDEHSTLEMEEIDRAWQDSYASDWRDAIRDQLAEYCPEAVLERNQYGPSTAKFWADDQLDLLPEEKLERDLQELFQVCLEWSGEGWVVEDLSCGAYIRLEKVAAGVDRSDLVALTGLVLLPVDQEWRRESYPWPDGSGDALAPALA
jgi:hypothetical protein